MERQRQHRQRDPDDDEGETTIGGAPALPLDERLTDERQDDPADADAGQGQTECEPAPAVEPEGDDAGEGDVRGAEAQCTERDIAQVKAPDRPGHEVERCENQSF